MELQNNFYTMSVVFGTSTCVLFILVGCHSIHTMSYQPHLETFNRSQEYIEIILNRTRLKIKFETWNYNFTYSGVTRLEDLIMESGGTPVRSVIVSTWRSGSSFLGDLLNAMPGNFYHYEPLIKYDNKQIRKLKYTDKALRMLKKLLMCNYSDMEDYFEYAKKVMKFRYFKFNTRLWEACKYEKELCIDANFSASFCRRFPFQTMKVVRLRLRFIEKILDDKELNVKAVLLIRDPRGVMQSRKQIFFCTSQDCLDPGLLCNDMIRDYVAANQLFRKYPDRLMVLRFEDLALNLNETTSRLLKFLRLQPNPMIDEFLSTHTNINTGNEFSTFRLSYVVPFKWKDLLDYNYVVKVQNVCKEAMDLWGYQLVDNASHMTSEEFYPLKPYFLNSSTNISETSVSLRSQLKEWATNMFNVEY